MTIDNNTGEFITQDQAISYTHDFQNDNPTAYKCFMAGSTKLTELLDQKDCIGIRIYRGYDKASGVENLVLVGVDSLGNDICTELFLERLAPCPVSCAQNSILVADN